MITITSNLAQWVERANDTASVFRRQDVANEVRRGLTRAIHQMNKKQIDNRGIGKSGSFKPLAPATVFRKGHDQPLVDTGKLYRQLTRGGSIKSGYIAAFRTFTYQFTVKTKPPGLLGWMMKGFRHRSGKRVPARPPIDPTKSQSDVLAQSIMKSVIRAWKRIGWFDRIGHANFTGFDNVEIDKAA